jgi:hypothetical protein
VAEPTRYRHRDSSKGRVLKPSNDTNQSFGMIDTIWKYTQQIKFYTHNFDEWAIFSDEMIIPK